MGPWCRTRALHAHVPSRHLAVGACHIVADSALASSPGLVPIPRFGLEGRLDCYCSEGLRLVQWLGPIEAEQVGQWTGRGTNDTSHSHVPNLNTCVTALQAVSRLARGLD